MPGKDGTGPFGMGPRSGRGYGPCAGYPVPSNAGYGMRFGGGRGCRWMAKATSAPGWMHFGHPVPPDATNPDQEKTILASQAKFLENQLEQIKDQLKKFEA